MRRKAFAVENGWCQVMSTRKTSQSPALVSFSGTWSRHFSRDIKNDVDCTSNGQGSSNMTVLAYGEKIYLNNLSGI